MDEITKEQFFEQAVNVSNHLKEVYNLLHWMNYTGDIDTQMLQQDVFNLQNQVENLVREVEYREKLREREEQEKQEREKEKKS